MLFINSNWSLGFLRYHPFQRFVRKRYLDAIQKDIDEYNPTFGKWEQIKKFELTPELWSIELGHLTPTMKVKRKVVKERYKDLFDKIYS